MLLTVVSGFYVDARGPLFLGSEVSKATCGLTLLAPVYELKPRTCLEAASDGCPAG
jgi:hypothetical protein